MAIGLQYARRQAFSALACQSLQSLPAGTSSLHGRWSIAHSEGMQGTLVKLVACARVALAWRFVRQEGTWRWTPGRRS
jgi:hypothetical protein